MKKNLVAGLVLALGTVFSAGADDVVTSFDYQASQARLLDVTPKVRANDLDVDVEIVGKRIRKTVTLDAEHLAPFIQGNDAETVKNLRSYAVSNSPTSMISIFLWQRHSMCILRKREPRYVLWAIRPTL